MPKHRILRPQTVRTLNSAVVLQLLRRHKALSRADLARHCGLSEGTVSRIVALLIQRGLVREDGAGNSTGGRPATPLRLDPGSLGIGVDLRNTEMQVAAATLWGSLEESITIPAPASPEETLKAIAGQFRILARRFGRRRIKGLGVSVRGLVNSRTGVVEFGNLPGWVGVPVRQRLQRLLRVPVLVDNNVRLAAMAEYDYGTSFEIRDSRCLLFVSVDEGVGIGIVLDGKPYYGPGDAAGEFGQMVIADSRGEERHDRPGCLERLVSNHALCQRYAVLNGGRATDRGADPRAVVRRICQLAIQGDSAANEALRETCRYLGIGIANVIWGLNADAVVMDATINPAWPVVAPIIADQFPPGNVITKFKHLLLRPCSLAGEGSIIGAATLPFRSLFLNGELQNVTERERRPPQGRPMAASRF